MLTHNLYPITYVGGTLGSSLGFFVSLHEGFYPLMPDYEIATNGTVGRQLEGILNINHTFEYINKQLVDIPQDKKISCRFNGFKRVEGPCVRLDDHRVVPEAVWPEVGNKIKPIIIEPNDNVLLPAQHRMKISNNICERLIHERVDKIKRNVLDKKQSPKPVYDLIEKLQVNHTQEKHYLLLDIIKLYELDKFEYDKLCDFVQTTPRADWQHGIESIKRLIDYNAWFK